MQDTLGNFLDKLFYENLKAFKSSSGNSASYTLDIRTFKKLKLLEIPGTGVAFVINPSVTQGGSVFNVSFEYSWEILKYVRNANLQTFGFDLRSYLNLLSNIFGITQKEFLEETINVFIGDVNDTQSIQDFVNRYNTNHTNPLTGTTFQTVFTELINFGEDIFQLIIDDYLNNVFEKLKLLIAKFIGPLDEERLKDLLLPQFSASIYQEWKIYPMKGRRK